MYRKTAGGLQVFLGDHDWTNSEEADSFRRSVQTVRMVDNTLHYLKYYSYKVKIHPQYMIPNNLNNDVCLLKLDKPISFPAHPNVRPICLPRDASNSYNNRKATVAGWGRTGGGAGISNYLQEIDVFVWPQSSCERTFGGNTITMAMMCISKNKNPIDATCNVKYEVRGGNNI